MILVRQSYNENLFLPLRLRPDSLYIIDLYPENRDTWSRRTREQKDLLFCSSWRNQTKPEGVEASREARENAPNLRLLAFCLLLLGHAGRGEYLS